MSNIVRGTTPTLTFRNTSDIDLSTLVEIWFTVAQKSSGTEITYSLSKDELAVDTATNTISLTMSQEDTLAFNPDTVEIQIRCLGNNDKSYASDIFKEPMDRIIKGGVISAPESDIE